MEENSEFDVYSDAGTLATREGLIKLSNNDIKLQQAFAYLTHKKERNAWYEELPEVIAWGDECIRISNEDKEERRKRSFYGLGLNVPGTLIEVLVDGKLNQYLIGDMNPHCGLCNDCTAFLPESIVTRYKVVWSPDVFDDNQRETQEVQTGECCPVC